MRKLLTILLCPLVLCAASDYLMVGFGAFDFYREKYRSFELDLEYKFHLKWLRSPFKIMEFKPLVGVMANSIGSGYLFLGLDFDFLIYDHLLIAPGFSAGYYWQGSGKNLGYPIEFRTSIELGWQFTNSRRIGVQFYHLSNASLGSRNPGEESLILFYDIPISRNFPFGDK